MRKYRVKSPAKGGSKRKPSQHNKRRFSKNYLESPELRWMDRFLRSFKKVAPADWIPAQYHPALRQRGHMKITLH